MRTTNAVALAVGLLLAAAYGPAVFGGYFGTDLGPTEDIVHLSVLYETVAGHIRAGSYPWWTPEFACGYPAFAAWMYGLLYPGLALFLLLPPEAAWTWTAILHAALGAAGMVQLARTAGCRDPGAAAAGVVFGLSEYLVVRPLVGHLNLLLPLAWAPWVLHYLLRTLDGDRRAVVMLVVTGSLGLLSGHVQTWFYVGLGALVVAACRAGWPGVLRKSPRLLLAAGVVAALTAVQWLPTLALLRLSDGGEAPADLLAQCSLTLPEGAARMVPGILGRHAGTFPWGAYTGGAQLGLEMVGLGGIWLLVPAVLARRGPAAPWIAVAIVGAFLAGGVHNVVGAVFHALPGLAASRAPARAQVLIVLALPIVVGLGIEGWLAGRDRLRLAGGVAFAALLAALSAVAAGRVAGVGAAQIRPAVVLTTAAIALVAVALFAARAEGPRRFLPAAALAVAAYFVGLPPVVAEPSEVYRLPWEQALPPELRGGRMHVDGNVFPAIERRGVRTTRQLSHVDSAAYCAFWHKAAGPPEAYWLDVRTVARRGRAGRLLDPLNGAGPLELLLLKRIETLGAGGVFARPGAELRPASGDPAADVRARVAAGERAAFVRRGNGFTRSAQVAGTVTSLESGSPNARRFAVESSVGGTVVLTERWMPGWTADVDGTPTDVLVAQTVLAAVDVPPGRHEITMRYRPPGRGAALIAFGLGLAALVVLGLRARTSDPRIEPGGGDGA